MEEESYISHIAVYRASHGSSTQLKVNQGDIVAQFSFMPPFGSPPPQGSNLTSTSEGKSVHTPS